MPVRNSKTPRALILDTYSKLINEYFEILNESNVMKETNFPISNIRIGITAIHRVFEIILLKTKNIEKTYYYSQRAYYYYLEYIDQIYQANLSQNINNMDIILFVYKKTIFDMYDGESDNNSNTLSNIMTLNDNTISIDDKDCRDLLTKMNKMMNVLFFWENTTICFQERYSFSNNYLFRFLNNIDNMDTTLKYLEIIQEKMNMNYQYYELLLKELLIKLESKRKKIDAISNEFILTKFYIDEHICREKFDNGNMREFVNWLYN
jgi:hypothetical protein